MSAQHIYDDGGVVWKHPGTPEDCPLPGREEFTAAPNPRDVHWQQKLEDRIYMFRERLCLWGETSGVTEAIARDLMPVVRRELDAYAAEVRVATLRAAADEVVKLRETTDTNVAVYPRYSPPERSALSDAESKLRRMAEGAES